MSKKFSGGMPGMNMNNLMKQAQRMQKQMEDMQGDLEQRIFDVSAGGGAVKVSINGKKVIQKISISPDVVDPDDIEMLEDLVLTAVNEAVRQADETVTSEMSRITGGVGLPNGLF